MLLIFDLQSIFYMQRVNMCIFCLHPVIHTSRSIGPLVIALKLKARKIFSHGYHLLILISKTEFQNCACSQGVLPNTNLKINGAAAPQVASSAIFLLVTAKKLEIAAVGVHQ